MTSSGISSPGASHSRLSVISLKKGKNIELKQGISTFLSEDTLFRYLGDAVPVKINIGVLQTFEIAWIHDESFAARCW